MPRENLSVSLSSTMRSLVEHEAKRGKRSRSAVVREALEIYFRFRRIGAEETTSTVARGRWVYKKNEFTSLGAWQNAVRLGANQ
jgi:metal-responsive CopG/Arc/MetJ family transcriptional regulator